MITEAARDTVLRSPDNLSIAGGDYSLVLVRLTRTAPSATFDGAIYYTTPKHGESAQFLAKTSSANPEVGETVILLFDMSRLVTGHEDWRKSVIEQVRLDLDDTAGGAFVIHQVAIVKAPPGWSPPPNTTP